MADMYGEKDRGKSLAMVTLLPYLGPALGPIAGGLVTELILWSWIFWIMSIFNILVLLCGLVVLHESYTPFILQQKTARLATSPPTQASWKDGQTRIMEDLTRPLFLLIHRPVVWCTALIGALSFGAYTMVLTTYATLWIGRYNQSELTSSLHYISIALGSTVCGQIGGHIMDRIYRNLSQRADGKHDPKFRIPYMVLGMILMPAGLFWYGWSARYRLHWAMVDLGIIIFTLGSFVIAQANGAYQISEFAEHAASAGAASRSISYILAFIFPIFVPQLFGDLGYGWGNTTLALVSISLGLPLCAVLWVWGDKIRAIGKVSIV